MNRNIRLKLSLPLWLLIGALAVAVLFFWWVFREDEMDRVRRFSMEYERHLVHHRFEEAKRLFTTVTQGDGPLDPIWIGLLETQASGYLKLEAYLRVLAGDPSREATYEEISNLVDAAPENFHHQMKSVYLADLRAVPEVRLELLEKYGLLGKGPNP